MTGGARGGVPQSGRLHALLDMGRTQVERWWPGMPREPVAAGVVLGSRSEIRLFAGAVRKVDVPGNARIRAGRDLLEQHTRRRTLGDEYVEVVTARAVRLVAEGDRVGGVRPRRAGRARWRR
ncbi:hypothetical protein [Streptomyces sp. NPDC091259]|uniref:hypothetical protein n=1 Tax=Streptomyces sp. NPDC091259 TaxID=3365976 RepID=UPI003812860E